MVEEICNIGLGEKLSPFFFKASPPVNITFPDRSSCSAYAYLDVRDGESGCMLWFGDLIDIRELIESGLEIYLRMATSELGMHRSFFPR